MSDQISWQDAIRAATPVAHREWKKEGLPGPHAVWTRGVYQGATMWIVLHGQADWLQSGDESHTVLDAPAVVVDRETGLPRVTTYLDIAAELEAAAVIGTMPDHLVD